MTDELALEPYARGCTDCSQTYRMLDHLLAAWMCADVQNLVADYHRCSKCDVLEMQDTVEPVLGVLRNSLIPLVHTFRGMLASMQTSFVPKSMLTRLQLGLIPQVNLLLNTRPLHEADACRRCQESNQKNENSFVGMLLWMRCGCPEWEPCSIEDQGERLVWQGPEDIRNHIGTHYSRWLTRFASWNNDDWHLSTDNSQLVRRKNNGFTLENTGHYYVLVVQKKNGLTFSSVFACKNECVLFKSLFLAVRKDVEVAIIDLSASL